VQLETNTPLEQKEVLAVCISTCSYYFMLSFSYDDVTKIVTWQPVLIM